MSLESNLKKYDKLADKQAELLEKELIKSYSLALKEIRGYMAEIYEKYGTPDGLPYSEMQKYNRMKSLEEQIKKALFDLTKKNAKVLEQSLEDIYELSYYSTGFALENETQVKLSYAMLNEEVVKQAVQNPISGLTLSERLEKNRIDLIYKVRQEITQGLIFGESYQKIAKRLKDAFEGDAKKSMRVAQTEAHRIKNTARHESMQHAQEKGIELKKMWMSTLDKKTRDRHRSLDGQTVEADQPFESAGATAMHPGGFGIASQDVNCRCTFLTVLDGFEPSVRSSRGEDGKTKVIPYQTYEEWKKDNIDDKKNRKTATSSNSSKTKRKAKFGIVDNTSINKELFGEYEKLATTLADEYGTDLKYFGSKEGLKKYVSAKQAKQLDSINDAFAFAIDDMVVLENGLNRKEIVNSMRKQMSSGFNVNIKGKELEYVITHEFGHIIDNRLKKKGVNFLESDITDRFQKEMEEYVNANSKIKITKGMSKEERRKLNKLRNEERKKLYNEFAKKEMSIYGTSNMDEFFAEAFAEYKLSDNPRKWALEVGRFIDDALKEGGK